MANWIEVYRFVVYTWECDLNGHMSVRHFLPKFDEAGDHVLLVHNVPPPALREQGLTTVTVAHALQYLAEGRDGDLLLITGAILRVGRSSVGLGLKLSNPHTNRLLSVCKSTLVLVNSSNGKSTQWPNKYREFLKSAVITLANEDIKHFES